MYNFDKQKHNKLIAAIHYQKKVIGLDNDTYRNFLKEITGKSSCSDMNFAELVNVANKLLPKQNSNSEQKNKLYALWCDSFKEGTIKNKSYSSMAKYVHRMTGRELKNCKEKELAHAIECLKKMLKRYSKNNL